jgi:multicomponent Na+:H+ antiporter subunit C
VVAQPLQVDLIYLVTAVLIFATALAALLLTHHLVRKVIALNVMASAVFLVLVVIAIQPGEMPGRELTPAPPPRSDQPAATSNGTRSVGDPLPHAMVLTGIVVSFGASALAIALARRIQAATGEARLPEEQA